MNEVLVDEHDEQGEEPKSGRVTVNFQVHLAQPSRRLLIREGPAPLPRFVRGRLPRVARMLVQAHLFQRMLETGQVRDLADLARRFKLTRARVTQISNYTLLAPDIQEEILAMPLVEPNTEPVREPKMRAVLREALWAEQRKRWGALTRECRWPETPRSPSPAAGRAVPHELKVEDRVDRRHMESRARLHEDQPWLQALLRRDIRGASVSTRRCWSRDLEASGCSPGGDKIAEQGDIFSELRQRTRVGVAPRIVVS